MKSRHILFSFILLLPLLFSGCKDDDSPVSSEAVQGTVTISSRAAADETITDAELIQKWWMVFVDRSNNIQLILDRPAGMTAAVEYEEVKFSIPRGTYTVYAFANIERSELEGLGLSFATGQQMPDLAGVVWRRLGKIGDLVPMTGRLDNVRIGTTSSERYTVEVVRLWAKLCFEFHTDTRKDLTVTNIAMTPALNDAVCFLPDYSSLGKAPVLPAGTVPNTLSIPQYISVPATGDVVSETFYLFESSAASHPTGHYPLSFDIKYPDGTTGKVNAVAYQLAHINRNDFVIIPVLITDWKVDLNVLFYPPIGGYPAVLTETKGDEFYARFGSGGKFIIQPTVTDASGNKILDRDLEIELTTEDPQGILTIQPFRDPKTLEITGEIGDGRTGRACVQLSIKIKADVLQHNIIRRFYIIRED